MKVLALLLAVVAIAAGNPYADTGKWIWQPRMPLVTPNIKTLPFPGAVIPPEKTIRIPGTVKVESCGTSMVPDSRVVNGNEAVPHSSPWQVALYIDNFYFCGGTLISNEWVLTAAHCTIGSRSIETVLGAHDLSVNEPTQVTMTSTGGDIITHSGYNSALLSNDVGLVHLPSPVSLTAEIQPVCLPSRSDADLGGGVMVTATGWGITSDGSSYISDVLNTVTDPTMTNADCAQTYGSIISEATICLDTSDGNKGVCSGDSGGPLIYNDGSRSCTRGVTSFVASAGCASGLPDGFTRTSHYLDWIETNTGIIIN